MRLSLLLMFMLFAFLASSQKTENYTPKEKVVVKATTFGLTFEKRHIELGKVKRGEKRETEFIFKNTGTEDIVIEIVSACECTSLDWPSRVKPGETGRIGVVFDSTEKEASETIEIDINLQNREKDTGYKRLEIISYSFELIP